MAHYKTQFKALKVQPLSLPAATLTPSAGSSPCDVPLPPNAASAVKTAAEPVLIVDKWRAVIRCFSQGTGDALGCSAEMLSDGASVYELAEGMEAADWTKAVGSLSLGALWSAIEARLGGLAVVREKGEGEEGEAAEGGARGERGCRLRGGFSPTGDFGPLTPGRLMMLERFGLVAGGFGERPAERQAERILERDGGSRLKGEGERGAGNGGRKSEARRKGGPDEEIWANERKGGRRGRVRDESDFVRYDKSGEQGKRVIGEHECEGKGREWRKYCGERHRGHGEWRRSEEWEGGEERRGVRDNERREFSDDESLGERHRRRHEFSNDKGYERSGKEEFSSRSGNMRRREGNYNNEKDREARYERHGRREYDRARETMREGDRDGRWRRSGERECEYEGRGRDLFCNASDTGRRGEGRKIWQREEWSGEDMVDRSDEYDHDAYRSYSIGRRYLAHRDSRGMRSDYNESSDGESSGEEERRKRGSRGGAAGGEKDQEWSVHGSESESESGHAEEWRERNRDTRRGIESDDDGSDDSAGSHRFDESDGLNVADEAFKAHKADHAVEGEETDEMDEAEGAEEADEANDLTACCEHPDLLDMDDADLLAVLPSCLAFVEESVNCGEKVLVHCHAGVSRSAAVVTAYLMKLHRSTAEDALRLLQSKHPLACPNDGFLHQLRIFHSMGWAVNPHHSDYSRFKLRLMARRITGSLHQGVPFEAGNGAASNGDAISGDAQLRAGVGQEGEVVAAAANVLPHAPKPPASATDPAAGGAAAGGGDGAAAAGTGGEGGGGVRFRGKGKDWRSGAERGCTSVFVEPLKWMGDGEHGWEVVRWVEHQWV
ncbi:unnamed protein product [Closterium sp. NIES-64]|nr:unnamed protein product [Closterium sp. NIES-64]